MDAEKEATKEETPGEEKEKPGSEVEPTQEALAKRKLEEDEDVTGSSPKRSKVEEGDQGSVEDGKPPQDTPGDEGDKQQEEATTAESAGDKTDAVSPGNAGDASSAAVAQEEEKTTGGDSTEKVSEDEERAKVEERVTEEKVGVKQEQVEVKTEVKMEVEESDTSGNVPQSLDSKQNPQDTGETDELKGQEGVSEKNEEEPLSSAVKEEMVEVKKEKEEEKEEKVAIKTEKSAELDGTEEEKAPSVNSDGGSDKENVNGGSVADTPDVIMLSDEEETGERKQQRGDWKKRVRRLQAELRNEEAKLVLLKKLRQSQLTPQISEQPPIANNSTNQVKQNSARQGSGPPPLVRGGQQGRNSNLLMQQQQSRSSTQSQMRSMQGPPPLVNTPRGANNSTNGHSSQAPRALGQQNSGAHRAAQQPATQQAATPPQPPVDTQTPAQRQAAAKLALRKQLEKTLLQIPPPKPPAPEMNFIPSLACPDFVLLLGLEEVVNHIIDLQLIARGQKSADEKFICNPFTCVQCGTDYTPVWKREKPGSKNVICEHCVTWNQKRALKQEHTNRLKSAFVKALQQEQEIERMQAQTPSNPSTPTPAPSVTPPSTLPSAPSPSLAAQAASSVAAAAALTMNSASYRASAEQVRQHHNFLQQAHQAQLRSGQLGFGTRSPFPYNLPYVKQADLQRQYLLDMIPRGGMNWKP